MSEDNTGRDLVPFDPNDDWTDAQWREFVQQATLGELDAILEKGRRIRLFHNAFNRHPSRWNNQDWKVTCREVLGISNSACSQYEKIYEVFWDAEQEVKVALPPHMYSLYFIARAYEKDSTIVKRRIETGKLWSGMERDNAKELLNFVETGNEVAVENLPVSRQVEQQGNRRREKIKPSMAEVVVQTLDAAAAKSGMSAAVLNMVLQIWHDHPSVFDAIQDLRKQYGDRDLVSTLRWLWEIDDDKSDPV
jgi:hypothetical protein